jgi:hypothetical protein
MPRFAAPAREQVFEWAVSADAAPFLAQEIWRLLGFLDSSEELIAGPITRWIPV